MTEYRTFKSKVVGLQFDKTVFDDAKVSQYITDNRVKGGKPKLTYDGKFLGVKLGKGKQQSMEQFSVVPGKDQGVSYLVAIEPVIKNKAESSQ